jgi:hypothetical protein
MTKFSGQAQTCPPPGLSRHKVGQPPFFSAQGFPFTIYKLEKVCDFDRMNMIKHVQEENTYMLVAVPDERL